MFGKKKAELEKQKQDSIANAQRIQDSLDAIQKRVSDSLAKIQQEEAEKAQQAALEQAKASALKFHVIVGSFRDPSNADNFLRVQQSSHPEAKIFDSPNGFKLVSIAHFATMEEAVSYINRNQGAIETADDEEEEEEYGEYDEEEEDEGGMWVYEEGGRYDTSAYLSELNGDDEEYGEGYE